MNRSNPVRTEPERAAYNDEHAYWLRHAGDHFAEAELPFIRWHQEQIRDNFRVPEGELVAEVGCGPGKLFHDHRQLLLIDFSAEVLARARADNPRCLAVCASVDRLPFRDRSLPNIVANNMLHHVKGEGLLEPAIDEIARVLHDDGRFYVNDRNPTLLHHLALTVAMTAKRILRRLYGEFGGCGSYNEPLFTRRDWRRIGQRFRFTSGRHYFTVAMWAVDSAAKGLAVVLRRERSFVARMQSAALPSLLWLERRLGLRPLCIERSVVAVKRSRDEG